MSSANVSFSNSVLIFGAGAHKPYGFPTSGDLTKKIKSLHDVKISARDLDGSQIYHGVLGDGEYRTLRSDKINICNIIADMDVVSTMHLRGSLTYQNTVINSFDFFLEEFGGAQVSSVDAFLSNRKEDIPKERAFIKIGKILILYFLLKHENSTKIGFHGQDWLHYFFDQYLKNPKIKDLFFNSPPTIISFNYDNFLEKSILSHLMFQHKMRREDALPLIKSLNIQHLYGHFNTLEANYEYSGSDFYHEILPRIQTISIERDNVGLIKQILDSDFDSKNYSFIGFGFDELNLNTLFGERDSDDWNSFSQIKARSTHVGLSIQELIDIQMKLPFHLDINDHKDRTCMDLFKFQKVFEKSELHTLSSVKSDVSIKL